MIEVEMILQKEVDLLVLQEEAIKISLPITGGYHKQKARIHYG